MKNDPDIVRWSQIKKFLIHWFCWILGLGFVGWFMDITTYNDNAPWENFILLLVTSAVMTAMTCQKN